ncbi:hypothetical protein NFI96_025324 [Prochilodus magdalenae]|nr:hypothetical protein NFI96_025324 [Prochilodus magdalenae]
MWWRPSLAQFRGELPVDWDWVYSSTVLVQRHLQEPEGTTTNTPGDWECIISVSRLCPRGAMVPGKPVGVTDVLLGVFRLTIDGYSSPSTEPSLSRICLTCPDAAMSRTEWRGFLHTLHQINSSPEAYEGSEEDLSSLLGGLESVSGLTRAELDLFSLTERWASWILSIIQACPALHSLKVATSMWNGLILEEGVRLLERSDKRPGCTLTVSGMRCQKPTDPCTVDPEKRFCLPLMMDFSCNQNVKLHF